MGVRKRVDAGEDLPLVGTAVAVRDPDQPGIFERVQITLDGSDPDAVEICEVFV